MCIGHRIASYFPRLTWKSQGYSKKKPNKKKQKTLTNKKGTETERETEREVEP